MPDTEITELEELKAEKVSGVANPANGMPFLVLKAAEPHHDDTESSEANDIEDEVVGKAVDALCLLHDYAMKGVADAESVAAVQSFVDSLGQEIVEKAKMKAKERHALPDKTFAYIDSKGGRHLPINDESHVRNALARFNQTHFESSKAKSAAARKIRAKAKSMGIEVSDDDNAAKTLDEAVEKSPGVPAESVETPTTNGTVARSGESGLGGPMTAGLADKPADPSDFHGGESTYVIPAEAEMDATKESWTIEVVDAAEKAGNWLSVENLAPPSVAASSTPGDASWEAYDASTLDCVARGLAAASRAVCDIAKREATEAVQGNPSDWFDAYDLGCAADDINQALGLVARLAYHEAAAETDGAMKAGRRLSAKTEAALRAAHKHLSEILGEDGPAPKKEADAIMATVTKEELDQHIAAETQKAVKKAFKPIKKRMKKLAKNANNGGDISAEQEHAQVHGAHDANDVSAVGGGETSGVTKSDDKQDKVLTDVLDKLQKMGERVEKLARRPRSGGPVLDGQARGDFRVAEGRQEQVTKSEDQSEIERLEKELEDEKRRTGPEAAARASDISQVLTLKRLQQAHREGRA